MDRLTSLTAFVRTVELGSQAAAAAELGLSRTMLGRHIQALEQHLGVRLINRTTRKQSLTEAGLAFFERCSAALHELEAAERSVSSLQAEPRGLLRLNAPMSFGARHLAPAIAAFTELHPKVRVELVLNDRVVDLVEEGYDLAIRIGRLADSSLIARRLAHCRVVLCAAPRYLERCGAPERPADLARHNCLLYSYAADRDQWSFRLGPVEETVRISGNFVANNGDAVVAAAVAGQGVVLQPTFIVGEALRTGALVRLLPGWEASELAIHAVYPHPRSLTPKVRSFVDFLVERYGGNPPWDAGIG
ncbi:LysR substrate-binding domain-containing protein [Benzoatithermus flavus]|uniref:LysR family transcriptional regulator n=1 Tax=Benzoatithermus flavus TaxID=3108223 RepID=A0ABU8XNQ5_9PROT